MKQIHMYSDFRMGLNTDSSQELFTESELAVADNIDLSMRGGTKKRNGFDKVNDSSYGGRVTKFFEWPRDDGTIVEMAVIDNKLCTLNPITKAKTDIDSVSLEHIGYFILQDKLYYLTGTKFRRFDGTISEDVPANTDQTNDLTAINKCKFVVRHTKSQRLFFAGNPDNQGALYYSEPGDPGFVKKTSVMFPTTGDGPITGIRTFVDAVVVFFQNSAWVWRGIDPEIDAVWHRLPTSEGTVSPHTICSVKTGLMYLGARGIIHLSPSIIGMNIESDTGNEAVHNVSNNRIENLIRSIKHPQSAVATYDAKNGSYILSYSDDETLGNNKILILDESGGFVRWTNIYANDLYYSLDGTVKVASDNYILKQVEDNFYDLLPDHSKEPVKFTMETPNLSLGSPIHNKLITNYRVLIEGQETTSTFLVDVIVDGKIVVSHTIENGADLTLIKKLFRKRGKRAALRVTNNDGNPFLLYGLGFESKVVNSFGERV